MATSGTYNYSVNLATIVRMAMLTLGKIDAHDPIDPQEYADMVTFVNMLFKQLVGTQDDGGALKCWNRRTGYLFLSGTQGGYSPYILNPAGGTGWTNSFVGTNTASTTVAGGNSFKVTSAAGISPLDNIGIMLDSQTIYWSVVRTVVGSTVTITGALPSQASSGNAVYDYTTAAQLPIRLETAVLRDAQGNDSLLRFMTREEFMALPSKASPTNISDPMAIYWEPQLSYSAIYADVYGCADMTKYIVLGYMETAQDITNPNDNPEFPQDWYLPLALGAAKLAAPMFNAPWTPVMEDNYKQAWTIAHNKDPDEVERRFFQPGDD